MDAIDHLRRMFEHLFWADRRILDRLRESRVEVGESVRLFAHLLAAEQVWLARIQGQDSSRLQIWPALSQADCAALARTNRFQYARYLHALSAAELERVAVYRNSRGVEHQTVVCDILTHVCQHGSYHRGQIATSLRAAGAQPVNTDFITFVREPGEQPEPLLPA